MTTPDNYAILLIMNKAIMIAAGFAKEVDRVEQGKCPLCGNLISINEFRNELSRKEFKISGMCQICQDKIFGE